MVSKKLTIVGNTYKHYLTVSATVELSTNGKPEAEREIKRTAFRTHGITQNVPHAWNHAKRSARIGSRKTFRTRGITQNVPHAWNHAKRSARMESRKTFRTHGITENVPHAWNHAKRSIRMESRKTFRTHGITQNVPHAWNHAKRIPHDASANHKRIRSRIRTHGILALGVSRGIGVPCDFLVVSRSVGG